MTEILVITTVHYYKDARIFFKEIKSLKKITNNLIYLAQHKNIKEFKEDDVHIKPLSLAKSIFQRIFKLQWNAYKIIKKLRPKIIHFHDPELIILMYILKKKLGNKIIFDIHENVSASFSDNLWLPRFSISFVKNFYNIIEKFIIKHFDDLIIAEESYRSTYGQKPFLIRNYPIVADCKKHYKDFSSGIKFVYSGSIRENRGAKLMLDVIEELSKKHDNISFELVGKIVPEDFKRELESFVKEKNLQNIVTIHGEIPLDEVYKILEKCHFGFSIMDDIENYRGSISTKIFDYMKFGVVPIVTNFNIYKEYISEPDTGLMVNNEINDIVTKVDAIINDWERFNSLNNNAYINLLKNWNWENEEKKLFELYKN
jgi:glycosyltransferase involved in cell wall biosynthesis